METKRKTGHGEQSSGQSGSFFRKKVLLSPKDIDQEKRRKMTLGHKSKNSVDLQRILSDDVPIPEDDDEPSETVNSENFDEPVDSPSRIKRSNLSQSGFRRKFWAFFESLIMKLRN